MPGGGSRVFGINPSVGKAVESHCGTSGEDHTEQNTNEIYGAKGNWRDFREVQSQCHAVGEQRKGKSKKRVCKTDETEIMGDGFHSAKV
jgi:hypothetical protein